MKTQGAKRPVPGVPGASWERTEYGTVLALESNAEFDALPKEVKSEMLDGMLKCMDSPHHIQRVAALRDVTAKVATKDRTEQPPADCPSAFPDFEYGPELPDIDAETFSVVFDYSNDGSKYFVLHDNQVILSGPAEHDVDSCVKADALREQFIKIARKLKARYGAQIVDLIATPKAESMLMDIWGWCIPLDEARKIIQQPMGWASR